eukprot:11830046-Alexandrium_andersonii.AAC.1
MCIRDSPRAARRSLPGSSCRPPRRVPGQPRAARSPLIRNLSEESLVSDPFDGHASAPSQSGRLSGRRVDGCVGR